MSEFVKRNMPVFIIGGLTVVLFLVIIGLSERGDRGSLLPDLVIVEQEEGEELIEPTTNTNTEETPTYTQEEVEEIKEQGFVPYTSGGIIEFDAMDRAMYEKSLEMKEQIRLTAQEVEERHGVLEISYTDQGFEPRDARGYVYQRVIFTNESENTIRIKPNFPLYDDWTDKEIKEIGPGGSLEFAIPKSGKWTYRELESNAFGSIFAKYSEIVD